MKLKQDHVDILVECLRRQQKLAATDSVPFWDREEFDEQIEHGPRYKPSLWFGAGGELPNARRQALLRCIYELHEQGLLIGWRRYGAKLSHIKITEAGQAAIEAASA